METPERMSSPALFFCRIGAGFCYAEAAVGSSSCSEWCSSRKGSKWGAAAGFVEACCANDDELLGLAEALGVDGGLAADHADGGELGDFVGEGHEGGDGAEGFVGEGGV